MYKKGIRSKIIKKKKFKNGKHFPGFQKWKGRGSYTLIYFHQAETVPTLSLPVSFKGTAGVSRPLGRRWQLTCSEPCSWPSSLQDTRFFQWGPWTWWMFPSRSPERVKTKQNFKKPHLSSCFIGTDCKCPDLGGCLYFFFIIFWRSRKRKGTDFH